MKRSILLKTHHSVSELMVKKNSISNLFITTSVIILIACFFWLKGSQELPLKVAIGKPTACLDKSGQFRVSMTLQNQGAIPMRVIGVEAC